MWTDLKNLAIELGKLIIMGIVFLGLILVSIVEEIDRYIKERKEKQE